MSWDAPACAEQRSRVGLVEAGFLKRFRIIARSNSSTASSIGRDPSTTKQIGFTIPPEVLMRADKLVE
jgi:hypothetical protein